MSNALKAVLVGCGGISGAWLTPVSKMEDVEIVGYVDLAEENARARREEFGPAEAVVGTDLAGVLEKTKPDMVFDCTVPEAHVKVTLTAFAHGCHVLGEKPLADTMENARRMVEASREAQKLYAVIQNRRYLAPIRRLKAFLETGAIGAITTINCDFYVGPHFGGFREEMDHVLLLDMAIHTFDAARMIGGADPVSVYCRDWNPPNSWYRHGASAMAIFEMTGGMFYNYRGSWCAEGCPTTWECDWRIVGERGTVLWNGGENFRAEAVVKTEGFTSEVEPLEIPPLPEGARIGGHAAILREFVDAVRSGAVPETTATDNVKSLAMVLGAIESAETGEQVRF